MTQPTSLDRNPLNEGAEATIGTQGDREALHDALEQLRLCQVDLEKEREERQRTQADLEDMKERLKTSEKEKGEMKKKISELEANMEILWTKIERLNEEEIMQPLDMDAEGHEENKRGDYAELLAQDDDSNKRKEMRKDNSTIIFVSEDRKVGTTDLPTCNVINATRQEMEHMDTISGMDAVFKKGITQERITSMLKTIKGDCILATHGCAITCIRFETETVQEFFTINGNTTELSDADGLFMHLYKEHEIWLIVGRTDGLEEEIQKDIIMTCKKAGFDDEYCKEILKRCNSDDNEQCKEVEERSDNTLLRIIMSPTVEELKNFMTKAILLCCCRESLKIVYCGHGTPSGDICLFDDQYEGAELSKLFNENTLSHLPPSIELYLNCCFAIDIASNINGKDALKLVENIAPLILEKDDAVASKDDAIETIVKAYYGDQDANEKFQKAYRDCLCDRSFHQKLWGNVRLNVFPLSFGILKAEGLCSVAFGLEEDVQEQVQIETCRFRSPWYTHTDPETLNTLFPLQLTQPVTVVENPTVKVFCAENGDSALFSWKEWNVVIDGGLIYKLGKKPCFRDEICKLNKLDLVVLTHGDADHVNGLLPFFKHLSNHPTEKFVHAAALLHKDMTTRNWSAACEIYEYANKANIPCHDISQPFTLSSEGNESLVIRFIHPPPHHDVMRDALKELKANNTSRTLTLINRASLVVYIECLVDNECKHRLLFTGDADGEDVIKALELLDKTFSYVDMPHHGSKHNNPQDFLSNIKAQNIGVSTNGKRFGHPDHETIQELCKYIKREENTTCHLHFNYKQEEEIKYDPYQDLKLDRVHIGPPGQQKYMEILL